jgi:Fe-S-cluster-containing dehydrogenase component
MDRRGFIKTLGLAGMTALTPRKLEAEEKGGGEDFWAVLVDTTQCAGCRTCEAVCAEANGLPEPDLDDDSIFETERKPSPQQRTVVNCYETEAGEICVKRQCLHCNQPACASACLTKAMLKTKEGPVIWREGKCMGCRFCMISCPADIPTFEYDSPIPKIQKCNFCYSRLVDGQPPACVENCPAEALVFGKREGLIEEARRRIHESPNDYVHVPLSSFFGRRSCLL